MNLAKKIAIGKHEDNFPGILIYFINVNGNPLNIQEMFYHSIVN